MKKWTFVTFVLLAFFAVAGFARAADSQPQAEQSFKVGGVPVVLPPPASEFAEMGYDIRERMEVLIPSHFRLIAAYLLSGDIQLINNHEKPLMSRYAFVEVLRQYEFTDLSPSEFKNVVSDLMKLNGKMPESAIKEAKDSQEEINRRLRSLNIEAVQVDAPMFIGDFYKEDAYYLISLVSVRQVGSKTIVMAVSAATMRVKNRLIFVTMSAEYKDKETVKWLTDTMDKWTGSILKANGQ